MRLLIAAILALSTSSVLAESVSVTDLPPLPGAVSSAKSVAGPVASAVTMTAEPVDGEPSGIDGAGQDAADAAMPEGLPMRLKAARARKAVGVGLEGAEALTGEIARTEDANARARELPKAKAAEAAPTLPKIKSPLAVVGSKIGDALDAVGSPVKPDKIRIYAGPKTVTIPVPRD